MRLATMQSLSLDDYEVTSFASAKNALSHIKSDYPDVVVTDLRMPGMDGAELLKAVVAFDPDIPVILISGHADIATAVQAIHDGAYDFIEKPYKTSQLKTTVSRALKHRSLLSDNRMLRAQLQEQKPQAKLLGKSTLIEKLNETLAYIAGTDADVLILGETGTGKELAATSLHQFSQRKDQRFVAINCGALPDTLIESELFGHSKGAFTGAEKDQVGKLEYANLGTFFLDEIESMPLSMQVKMLRVLQERKIQRIGNHDDIDLNIRVVAASKIDLHDAAKKGDFRDDLYYRLNVVSVEIPPLRERKEDRPILFAHFFTQACERMNQARDFPSDKFVTQLMEHNWPGNVRELQHTAERAAIGLTQDQFLSEGKHSSNLESSLSNRVDAYEKLNIERELSKHAGNLTLTYQSLGISRKTLYDKMKKHGLSRLDWSSVADDLDSRQ